MYYLHYTVLGEHGVSVVYGIGGVCPRAGRTGWGWADGQAGPADPDFPRPIYPTYAVHFACTTQPAGTRSGSGAQVWHLNVHYSPFFNGFGGFSPVLLSAGGVGREQRVDSGGRRTAAGGGRAREIRHRSRALGRRWAGRAQGWRRGGGDPFFHAFRRGTLIWHASREFAPRCESHPARAKCGPMIRMSSG
eukprot:gene14996-biopygen5159